MTARVEDFLAARVAAQPDALALSDTTGLRWSYADLDRAADELAAVLQAQGARPGDRVLLLAENCAAAVAALFACWKMRAIAVPVNSRQTPAEVTRVLDHARPAVAVMTSQVSPEAARHAADLGSLEVGGRFGRLDVCAPCASNPDEESGMAVVLYTTGTTGAPKGVMLSHGNLRFGGQASAGLRGMAAQDVICGVLPVTHVFGLASIVTAGISAGARIDLQPRFSAPALYEALRADVTLFSGVPQMHALLMQYSREQGLARLGSARLRYVSSGAAPLDPAWKRKAEAFYGVALQNGYGLTESTAGVSASRNPLGSPDISCGPPLPGVEVRIDETVAGGGGGTGEVLTRGPHVMSGYYRNPAATAAVMDTAGWLRTGDLGRMDAQGHLHIVGRSKELIIHGGFNVYPPEVEAALNDHPEVIQCAVIGRSRDGDEEVLAFVQVAQGCTITPEILRDFAAARLAGYKRPSRIVLATALPAAPTGKILKHRLLEVFADRLG